MDFFSKGRGYARARDKVQRDSLDRETRTGLWNVLVTLSWYPCDQTYYEWHSQSRLFTGFFGSPVTHWLYKRPWDESGPTLGELCMRLWAGLWKQPLDTMPEWPQMYAEIRKKFFDGEWYEVFDLLEFIAALLPPERATALVLACNRVLEEEQSAYRFVGLQAAPLTSEEEIAEVEEAIGGPLEMVRDHLQAALRLLSDRTQPDYRNSMKESISAVEALARALSAKPNATFAEALKAAGQEVGLHPALVDAFVKIYGYACDAGGIRHAVKAPEDRPSAEDARWMLVTCSAFVNLLIVKAAKAGKELGA